MAPGEQVQHAVAALAQGRLVVVVDDADRENEGDLVGAARTMTAAQMAFLVRHTTGIVCAPMPGERADALRLRQMVADNTDAHGTAFTVSVDHASAGTGVSAADRTTTVRRWRTRPPNPVSCAGPATCSRCGRVRAECWCGPGTRKRPSTCWRWPARVTSA